MDEISYFYRMSIKSTVIIAGSGFLVTEGLKSLFYGNDKFTVTGVAGSVIELKSFQKRSPHIVIIDVSSDDFIPAELQDLKRVFPSSAFIVIAAAMSHNTLKTVSEAGIHNILLHRASAHEIITAAASALQGKKYYSSEILDMIIEPLESRFNRKEDVQLTASEKEIVRHIAGGLTTKEIAGRKNISIHTVSTHRKNIFRKLGISNASELIMKSIKAGWIDNIEYYI
jgi:DNA-binding NarL/FixJ family response regulator